jgi:hypothetical protein
MNIPLPDKKFVQPKIIKPIDAQFLVNLALDIWRLEIRMAKLKTKLDENMVKPMIYQVNSCLRNLLNMGIQIKDDYTGKIYKTSMNLDVVSYESVDMTGTEAIVKETIEPAILFNDTLLHKAKVIIATPRS